MISRSLAFGGAANQPLVAGDLMRGFLPRDRPASPTYRVSWLLIFR